MKKIQGASPVITYDISCYHYETQSSTDSDGKTITREVAVETHHASMSYDKDHMKSFEDETLDPAAMIAMFQIINGTASIADPEKGTDIDYVAKDGSKTAILLVDFPLEFPARDLANLFTKKPEFVLVKLDKLEIF